MAPHIVAAAKGYVKAKAPWFLNIAEEHAFEIGNSLSLILFGLRALLTDLQAAPGSIQILPHHLAEAYCLLAVLGGCSILFGLFGQTKLLWAYGFERAGLFIAASAWAAYIFGLSFGPITAKSTLLILAISFMSVSCLIRARVVNRRVRGILYALRYANENKET